MWVMFIIACLVCILDKTGYLLDDNLEKLLYVEDSSKPSNTQDISTKQTEQEQSAQNIQDESNLEHEINSDNELDLHKEDSPKQKRGNPIKPEDALYEIKKASQ